MAKNSSPYQVDVHVGQIVKLRRKQVCVSQTALAEALGIPFQQVQKYENGANRISASMLFKIAQKLGVKIGYFFEGLEGQSSESGVGPADRIAMAVLLAIP